MTCLGFPPGHAEPAQRPSVQLQILKSYFAVGARAVTSSERRNNDRPNVIRGGIRSPRILLVDDDPYVTEIIAIFLRQSLPGKDGGEVAIEFRNDPLLKDVTLIFMSGLISAKEKGVRNGAVYLPKPFPLAALKQVIDIILTGRNAAEEQWSGSRAHLSSEVNFEAVASN